MRSANLYNTLRGLNKRKPLYSMVGHSKKSNWCKDFSFSEKSIQLALKLKNLIWNDVVFGISLSIASFKYIKATNKNIIYMLKISRFNPYAFFEGSSGPSWFIGPLSRDHWWKMILAFLILLIPFFRSWEHTWAQLVL